MAYKFNPFTGQLDDAITLTGSGSVAAAQDGTAALPGISFANDLNTGIYRPGADQVAISTNGTGQLFIDSSGNVGVGTDSPNGKLEIKSTSAGADPNHLILFNESASSGTETSIYFAPNLVGTIRAAKIAGINEDGGNSTALTFSTNLEANTPEERMRITSDGKLGLGTSSPGNPLTVVGPATNVALAYLNATDAADGNGLLIRAGGFNSGKYIASLQDGAGNTRLHVLANGSVGVGTTVAQSKLSIGNGSSTSDGLSITFTGDNSVLAKFYADTSTGEVLIGGTAASYFPVFYSANSERARIDTSGRLLVGTSSVRSQANINLQAQVEGVGSAYGGLGLIENSNNAIGSYLILSKSRGTAAGSSTVVASGDRLGSIWFTGADGTDINTPAAFIAAEVDGTPGANDMPGRLIFSTTADGASAPTERMRINKNGAQQSLSANDVYRAASETAAGTSFGFYYGYHSATTTQNGTLSYLVNTNGNVLNTNNSYAGISDAKLKENIVDATSQWSDIKALQVRNYNFKEGQTHTQIGLIAQEVELVSPGLVSESPDRDEDGNDLGTVTKSVNYSVLYMKAVKALQEAMERIETLEAKIAALESA